MLCSLIASQCIPDTLWDTLIEGDELDEFEDLSYDECLESCDETEDCIAFHMYVTNATLFCTLFSEVDSTTENITFAVAYFCAEGKRKFSSFILSVIGRAWTPAQRVSSLFDPVVTWISEEGSGILQV